MVGMKRDCAGAAAILGAFHAIVKSKFKHNLHAIFCLAENSVGPDSTRPMIYIRFIREGWCIYYLKYLIFSLNIHYLHFDY